LNVFLEVESGAGTFAPRRRQAYASKRLQQVVTDFRKERAKLNHPHGGSPTPSQDGDFASEENSGPTRKRRRTTASNKRKKGVEKSTRGRTRKRTSTKAKDTITSTEESMDDGNDPPTGPNPSRTLGVELRPRPEHANKMDASLAEDSSEYME